MKTLIVIVLTTLSFQIMAASQDDCATTVGRAKVIQNYAGPVPSCNSSADPTCGEEYILAAACPRSPDRLEKKLLVDALSSPQIRAQVEEFGQLVEHVQTIRVESVEGLDTITLSGTVIRGGDVGMGNATLTISRTFGPTFGFSRSTIYAAKLSKNLVGK